MSTWNPRRRGQGRKKNLNMDKSFWNLGKGIQISEAQRTPNRINIKPYLDQHSQTDEKQR